MSRALSAARGIHEKGTFHAGCNVDEDVCSAEFGIHLVVEGIKGFGLADVGVDGEDAHAEGLHLGHNAGDGVLVLVAGGDMNAGGGQAQSDRLADNGAGAADDDGGLSGESGLCFQKSHFPISSYFDVQYPAVDGSTARREMMGPGGKPACGGCPLDSSHGRKLRAMKPIAQAGGTRRRGV